MLFSSTIISFFAHLTNAEQVQQGVRFQAPMVNGNGSDAGALKIGSMTNNAVNKVIAETIQDPQTKAMLNKGIAPECINRISEPNNAQLKQIEIQKCVQAKQENAQQLTKAVMELQKGKSKCVAKLDINAQQCDIEKAIESLLKQEYFKVTVADNMYVVSVSGAPLGLSLFEHINYDVEVEREDETTVLENPDAELVFNEAGILIGQTGNIKEEAGKENPCASCFEKLQTVVVDGTDKCGGCDTDFLFKKSLDKSFSTKYKYVDSEGKTQSGTIR